jgi:hypothetical protein
MNDFPPLNWSDEEFESWRYIQDDYADQVAEAILQSPHAVQVYRALGNIQKNNDPVDITLFQDPRDSSRKTDEEHDKLVVLLNAYFSDKRHFQFTPEQKKIIAKASEFYSARITDCTLALAVRSLLKQYSAFKACNVLVFTKLLTQYPHRRILETMQFVMDVMDPKGMDDDGYAIRSIQKLRLIHAMIRSRIKHGGYDVETFGEFNEKEWGMAINQQDMILAIHTFSIEVLDGLKANGDVFTDEERETFYQCWHYYARALGVRDEINPTNYADGLALQERIYKVQFSYPNPNGPALAEPLVTFLQQIVPFHPKLEDIYAIIKMFNDEKDFQYFEDNLKLPLHSANKHFLTFMKDSDKLMNGMVALKYLFTPNHKKPAMYNALAMVEYNFLNKVVNVEKTWGDKHFRIADGFGDQFAKEDAKKTDDRPSLFIWLFHRMFFKDDHATRKSLFHKMFDAVFVKPEKNYDEYLK